MAMTDAERLFFTGGAHARAAHAIVVAAQQSAHLTVPFYLLVGFSLETVLKAVFIHLGGHMKVAKDEIRHDLQKAFILAKERGFQPGNEHLEWLTQTLAEVHRNHSFRYLPAEGDLNVADETHCLAIIDDLVVQVGQLLYPEHEPAYWVELLTQFDPRNT